MKIKGQLTLLINRDYTEIEVHDKNANTCFTRIRLTPEQLSAALSRQGYVDCELQVYGLDKIGKTHECKSFEFAIPPDLAKTSKEKELAELAQSQLTDGWVAEEYFRSQNTFFEKDGVQYARCTIRRYV